MFTEKIELKRQVFIELKGSDEKRTLKSIFLGTLELGFSLIIFFELYDKSLDIGSNGVMEYSF